MTIANHLERRLGDLLIDRPPNLTIAAKQTHAFSNQIRPINP